MACWGLDMELVVAGICCLLKTGIDGGGIVLAPCGDSLEEGHRG